MHGYDWMPGYGGAVGGGIFMLLLWAVFIFVLALAAGWAFRLATGRGARPTANSALQILEERYARGEIEREEYLAKRQDLQR